MKTLGLVALLWLASLSTDAQIVRFSLQVNPRGHGNLSKEQLRHFTPFDTSSLAKGMKQGDPMQEITAADILEASTRYDFIALVHHEVSCIVIPFPTEYWQTLEDSVKEKGGRLIVVAEGYDGFDSLQARLAVKPITYPVYVMSARSYPDQEGKASKRYWTELLQRRVKKPEAMVLDDRLAIVKRGIVSLEPMRGSVSSQ